MFCGVPFLRIYVILETVYSKRECMCVCVRECACVCVCILSPRRTCPRILETVYSKREYRIRFFIIRSSHMQCRCGRTCGCGGGAERLQRSWGKRDRGRRRRRRRHEHGEPRWHVILFRAQDRRVPDPAAASTRGSSHSEEPLGHRRGCQDSGMRVSDTRSLLPHQ